MSEDKELLTRISQVAGHINRHRNQQKLGMRGYTSPGLGASSLHSTSYNDQSLGSTVWRPSRGRPYSRMRARGGRSMLQGHRNRSLVLNNMTNPTSATDSSSPASAVPEDNPPDAAGSSTSWVAKRDRHMQLINSSVFDRETQARARAMEETRKQKTRHKEQRQRLKFTKFLQNASSRSGHPSVRPASDGSAYREVVIGNVRYQVTMGGSKLQKAPDDINSAEATPKKTTVGGVTFLRSKNGNLWRSGVVRTRRKQIHKVPHPCKYFTTTGTCSRGPLCPYVHDASKVAICKEYLQKGSCPAGDVCDLSHNPTPHRVPTCVHFLRGMCSNPHCRYAHVRVNPKALICRHFATLGFCDKGDSCTERHVHECPDYGNTGACNNKHCKLPHVDRAGQIRKTTVGGVNRPGLERALNGKETAAAAEDESDISSEDEYYDEIDSDDVDSDGLDEELTSSVNLDEEGREISRQQDFIHF